jgi:hypothetical protein
MIRTCPKCRAFYADAHLTFCYADGTPLAEVQPNSEKWHEASRSIQEKATRLHKARRNRTWRRIVLGGLTTLLLTLVVTKSFDVETTTPLPVTVPSPSPSTSSLPTPSPSDSASPSPSISPSPSPSSSRSPSPSPSSSRSPSPSPSSSRSPSPSPSSSRSPSPSPSPSPPPSPSPSPSPSTSLSPVVLYKISGRVISAGQPLKGVKVMIEGSMLTSTTTDANGNYTFSRLRAGGSYTITPRAQASFSPPSRSFNNLRRDEPADFVGLVKREEKELPTPTFECSDAEKRHIGSDLIAKFAAQWRRSIERDRSRIIAETVGVDVRNAEATLGPIEFRPTLAKCSAAVITARYAWTVRADLHEGVKAVTVPKVKRFACGKVLGVWLCS